MKHFCYNELLNIAFYPSDTSVVNFTNVKSADTVYVMHFVGEKRKMICISGMWLIKVCIHRLLIMCVVCHRTAHITLSLRLHPFLFSFFVCTALTIDLFCF